MGLVITKNLKESFTIGPDIKITVVGILFGDRVRLHIEAPEDVEIRRGERARPGDVPQAVVTKTRPGA